MEHSGGQELSPLLTDSIPSDLNPKQTLQQAGSLGLTQPFGGPPTGQNLESPPRLAFELLEEFARTQWLAGVGRAAGGIALRLRYA